MARVVGRSRVREGIPTGQKLSEMLIIAGIGLAILAGIRYYFVVYRNSAGFALGEYFGAIKSGDVDKQYALIDAKDKQQYFPTKESYEKDAKQARGYTTRITNVQMIETPPDPKKPDIAVIDATVSVRAAAGGKELYQTGETKDYSNHMYMRKDADGKWKVWLSKSIDKMDLLKAEANPPGSSFN